MIVPLLLALVAIAAALAAYVTARLRVRHLAHGVDESRAAEAVARREAAQSARETDALLAIARAAASTLEERELLNRLTRIAARACDTDRCTIYRCVADEADGVRVVPAMSQFADGRVDRAMWEAFRGLGKPRLSAIPFLAEAVRTRAPVVIADAVADPRVPASWLGAFAVRSLFAVPLVHRDRVLAVLVFDDVAAARPIAPAAVAFGGVLAEQIALVMQSARLFAEAEARRREAEIVAELAAAINDASLDLDTVLRRVADGARELCRSEVAAIALRHPESGAMCLAYRTDRDGAGAQPEAGQVLVDGPGRRGAGVEVGEEYAAVMRREGAVAVTVVRVVSEEGVEGLLYVGNRSPRPFTAADRAVLARLADHAAIALRNARLYRAARQAYQELARAQDQLGRAQKMEAVGRLAGGVAHDFNNLLTVIGGHSELALEDLAPDAPLRPSLELIRKTADRAAVLTRQLLAVSRRQLLQPVVLDLNAVVTETGKMLRVLVGEGVELVTALDPAAGRVQADPGQLEQVVMNLVVNARDAMPGGGTLTIATGAVDVAATGRPGAGVAPGRYATLRVADTGIGMDAATRARIFEPFFTTKGPGRGTGLGLATVYGIVDQSGGHIEVESAPGAGTTFTVYLPRGTAAPAPVAPPVPTGGARRSGSETVLLVEDEDAVRGLARTLLETLGYAVLDAAGGAEALRVAEGHPGPIHLLLTDVVMPQMSGPDLAARLAVRRPDTRVLYVSGYTDDALGHHGMLDPAVALLPKPFTADALGRKVREVLDATCPAAAALQEVR